MDIVRRIWAENAPNFRFCAQKMRSYFGGKAKETFWGKTADRGKIFGFFGTWNGEIRDRREASGAGRQGFLINKSSDEAGKKVYSRAIGGLKGSAGRERQRKTANE